MLIGTNLTVAYKCSACGTFEFVNISFFDLLYKKECHFTCRCGKSGIITDNEHYNSVRIHIPCMACGDEHTFVLGRKKMLARELCTFSCPRTGMQQCFTGSDIEVGKRIDKLEKELDELMNTFGYEDYFENTRVMFDVLNKIHDIAEQGNLCCECGNYDIELVMLPDRIQLKCKKCSGENVVHAASNEDLKDVLSRQYISLVTQLSGYKFGHTGEFN